MLLSEQLLTHKSIIVKVMKRIVCHQLISALEESQHISDYKFVFMEAVQQSHCY